MGDAHTLRWGLQPQCLSSQRKHVCCEKNHGAGRLYWSFPTVDRDLEIGEIVLSNEGENSVSSARNTNRSGHWVTRAEDGYQRGGTVN